MERSPVPRVVFWLIALAATSSLLCDQRPSNEIARAQSLQQGGRSAEARAFFQQILTGARRKADVGVEAAALQGLAQVDLALGHYPESISEGSQALSLYGALRPLNQTEVARTRTTVAQGRFYTGDTNGALRDFELAFRDAQRVGDRAFEITALNNIGNVYYALGRFDDAFRRYRDAEDRARSMPSAPWFASRMQLTEANIAALYQRIGQYGRALDIYNVMEQQSLPGSEQAQMFANIGALFRRLGDPVSALEKYRAAQQLFHKTTLLAGEAGVLNNIGIVQAMDFHDFRAAIDSFGSALQMAEKAHAKRLLLPSLLYRGEALLRGGETSAAKEDFERAAELAQELKAGEESWRADFGLARISSQNGDRAGSNRYLLRSAATIEQMRVTSGAARAGFLAERRDVYDLLIRQESSAPHPDFQSIFDHMERSRSRILQDQLHITPARLSDLQSRLPEAAVMLDYWVGEDSVLLLSITKMDVQIRSHPIGAETAGAFRELPNALANPDRKDWTGLARICSDALLRDAAPALLRPVLRKIIVVPDGELARIPFEVLPSPDNRGSVIEHFSVSYLPFASALRAEGERRAIRPPWTRMFSGFANPASGASRSGLALQTRENLPDAEQELKQSAAVVGGRADLFRGRSATKEHLYDGAAAPILHFATHAFADLESPDRSWILFAGGEKTGGFEYLFLSEAATLASAKGKLVTVSACDSGNGKLARGEGIQNFAGAFLAAGARGVVSSLWRVGDKSSAAFMTRFYDALAAGSTGPEALRIAKLAFVRSKQASHPAFWAGFIFTGDSGLSIPKVIPWSSLILLIAAIATGAAIVLGRHRIRTPEGMR